MIAYGVIRLIVFSSAIGLYGCSSGPKVKVEPLPPTADPAAELMRLDENLEQAKASQVDVYAPETYTKATKAYREAKEKLDQGKDNKQVLQKIAEGDAYLQHADETAQISETALGNVVEARNRAVEAQAPQLVSKQFSDADRDLKKVVNDVEGGNTASARSKQAQLEKEFQRAELNAKLQGSLGPTAGILKTAKNEDAKKWAPRSLVIAERQFNQAKTFILKNPQDNQEIQRLSSNAQAAAEQALTFTREAKKVKKQPPEETVAQMEGERRELQAYQEKNALFEAALAEQQGKIQQLESRQAIDQKFAKARAQFKPDEGGGPSQGRHFDHSSHWTELSSCKNHDSVTGFCALE